MADPSPRVTDFTRGYGAWSAVAREDVLRAAYAVLIGSAYADFSLKRVARVAGSDEKTLRQWWDGPSDLAVETFFALLDLQESDCAMSDFRAQSHGLASQLRGPMGRAFTKMLADSRESPLIAAAVRKRWLDPRRSWARERMARAAKEGDLREGVDPRAALALIYSPIYSPLLFGKELPGPEDLANCFDLAAKAIFRD